MSRTDENQLSTKDTKFASVQVDRIAQKQLSPICNDVVLDVSNADPAPVTRPQTIAVEDADLRALLLFDFYKSMLVVVFHPHKLFTSKSRYCILPTVAIIFWQLIWVCAASSSTVLEPLVYLTATAWARIGHESHRLNCTVLYSH